MTEKLRKQTQEMNENYRQEIRESRHGLLKLVSLELIPFAWGVALGGVGRSTEAHWIPAVPVGIDLMMNAQGYSTPRGLWGVAKYGTGISLPYADKIYQALAPCLINLEY